MATSRTRRQSRVAASGRRPGVEGRIPDPHADRLRLPDQAIQRRGQDRRPSRRCSRRCGRRCSGGRRFRKGVSLWARQLGPSAVTSQEPLSVGLQVQSDDNRPVVRPRGITTLGRRLLTSGFTTGGDVPDRVQQRMADQHMIDQIPPPMHTREPLLGVDELRQVPKPLPVARVRAPAPRCRSPSPADPAGGSLSRWSSIERVATGAYGRCNGRRGAGAASHGAGECGRVSAGMPVVVEAAALGPRTPGARVGRCPRRRSRCPRPC